MKKVNNFIGSFFVPSDRWCIHVTWSGSPDESKKKKKKNGMKKQKRSERKKEPGNSGEASDSDGEGGNDSALSGDEDSGGVPALDAVEEQRRLRGGCGIGGQLNEMHRTSEKQKEAVRHVSE